ncbi:MAG: transposase [Endozoicomonadaceae bacterium]|nr:transposase [Endozoicomonadaceae bacterium]
MLKYSLNAFIIRRAPTNIEGQKELLGIWISENEGAKFWLNVLTELQNCDVEPNTHRLR